MRPPHAEAAEQSPKTAPWLFPGAKGGRGRPRDQLLRRKVASKYLHRESPHPALAATGAVLLTGTAWHSLGTSCDGVCAAARGACAAPLTHAQPQSLRRCDCSPYAWGPRCSIPVRPPHRLCILNDSDPWHCHTPLCQHSTSEAPELLGVRRQCEGRPLVHCPLGCSGRGQCGYDRKCTCFTGVQGEGCEVTSPSECLANCSGRGVCEYGFCRCAPPFWGIDCAQSPTQPPLRCSKPPCVYVYELPARMNVLARNAHGNWRSRGDRRYTSPMHILDAVLSSPHRTTDPTRAHFFFIPAVSWIGCWGTHEVYYRAHRYVSTTFPFWNASGGTDHVWLTSADVGSCKTPWGSLREEMGASTVLTLWGGVTGLQGEERERCYQEGRDVVVPHVFNVTRLLRSPMWAAVASPATVSAVAAAAAQTNDAAAEAAAAAALAASAVGPSTTQLAMTSASLSPRHSAAQTARASPSARLLPTQPRTTQLLFAGSLCWPTWVKVKTAKALEEKCRTSDSGGDTVVAHYGFGTRYEVYQRHASVAGFKIIPTDYTRDTRAKFDLDAEMARARFCLAPTGSGWGARAVHAALFGCVPVLVQHDGVHAHVAQPFEPSPLSWDDFAVRVSRDQIRDLPAVLDAVNLTQKQHALRQVWTRMVWRSTLPQLLRPHLPGMDAFASTMEALSKRLEWR